MNTVCLVGHVGNDYEPRETKSGGKVINLRLATREGKDRTEWHNVVAFDQQADILERFTGKGSEISVNGRLATRTWEDRDGNQRRTTEIVAHRIGLIGGKGDKQEQGGGGYGYGN